MSTIPIEKMHLGVYFLHCNRAAEVERRGVGPEWPHLERGWGEHNRQFAFPLAELGWSDQMHWQSWGCEPQGPNNPAGTQEVDAHLRIRDAWPAAFDSYAEAMQRATRHLSIRLSAYIGNPWDTHFGGEVWDTNYSANVHLDWQLERAARCMDFFRIAGVEVWMDALIRWPGWTWESFLVRHQAWLAGGEGWPDTADERLTRMPRILNTGTRQWLAQTAKLSAAKVTSLHPGPLTAMLGTGYSDKRVLHPDPVAATVLEIREAQALGCEACLVTSHVVLQAKLTPAKLLALAADLDWPAKAPQAAGGQKK